MVGRILLKIIEWDRPKDLSCLKLILPASSGQLTVLPGHGPAIISLLPYRDVVIFSENLEHRFNLNFVLAQVGFDQNQSFCKIFCA